jgi:hypothetical protein
MRARVASADDDRSPVRQGLDRGAAATMLCVTWDGQVAVKVANAGTSPACRPLRSGAAVLSRCGRAPAASLFARDGTLRAGIAAGPLFALGSLIFWGLVYTCGARGAAHLAPFVVAIGPFLRAGRPADATADWPRRGLRQLLPSLSRIRCACRRRAS